MLTFDLLILEKQEWREPYQSIRDWIIGFISPQLGKDILLSIIEHLRKSRDQEQGRLLAAGLAAGPEWIMLLYDQTTLKDLVSPQDSAVADTLGTFGSVSVAALFPECDILLENREHLERAVLRYLYYKFAKGSPFYVCLDLGPANGVVLSAVLNT
jgi:hypothetical protein